MLYCIKSWVKECVKMASAMRDDEIKLLILYLLDQLKTPLSGEVLSEIVLWDGNINFFDFSAAFDALTQSRALLPLDGEGAKTRYTLSPEGQEILRCMGESLSESIRYKALRSATRLLAYRNQGRSASATLSETADGFSLRCVIRDREEVFMDLTLYPKSRYEAESFKIRFENNPEDLLRGVLAILSGQAKFLY